MERKITIRDVAKYAGVSVASVSNVLNNKNKVSEETKKSILQAIDDLGYQMDFTARSLSNKKSNLVGVVLPVTEKKLAASILLRDNPYFAEFISGVDTYCKNKDYDMLMTAISDTKTILAWVRKRNIDGVIFLGCLPKDIMEVLKKNRTPMIVIDNYDEDIDDITNIGIDELKGGYLATKHLLDLGHKNIVFCGNDLDTMSVNGLRYQGYKLALEKYKVPFNQELTITADITLTGGKEVVNKIINSQYDITAIFCVGDILALGVIKELNKLSLSVPEDYSVIGFDDLNICKYITPELTTVRQDILKKGIRAGEAIIEEIEFNGSNEKIKEIMPIKLVERGTTLQLKRNTV